MAKKLKVINQDELKARGAAVQAKTQVPDTGEIIAWFSAGATSAVACKIALAKYGRRVRIVYIETGSAHADNERFLKECEAWYGAPIEIIRNQKYTNHFEVIGRSRFINSPHGARCTTVLKKDVRNQFEKENPNIVAQVWGFEFDAKEIMRAKKHASNNPHTINLFPLVDDELTKENALGILSAAGIELPAMYRLGYNNNNCLACVKGGMGYWNRIRKDFPEHFERMAKLERLIGHSCLREKIPDPANPGKQISVSVYLDELDPMRGRSDESMPDCMSSEVCTMAVSKYSLDMAGCEEPEES